ncbi:placenta-specific gene 8 protein-like [Saccostrea echinata]|uniref:placenta-specific gene 8 protein-like n=1 Tax=Saccostrea echinata TaxID=191078 RepID=UPI002A807DE7|nr:placenta-specific gene 8 protein-like [Saccostrea echinata]
MANTVIVQQPTAAAVPDNQLMVTDITGRREWSTGLFDIFTNVEKSLLTYFFTPCYKYKLATRTGEGCCLAFCVTGAMTILRSRIRTIGGIRGSATEDFLVVSFCQPCAMCQMDRELDRMGVP